MDNRNTPTPERKSKLPFLIFFAIATYFLWTEHQAHVIEYLPFAFLFACVGIHFFMHGSHGTHSDHNHHAHKDQEKKTPTSPQLTHESVSEGSETDRSNRHD